MGRPSKLSEKQWAEVERRLLAGEVCRALAREFGVSDGAIRQRLSARVDTVKAVANQMLAADKALNDLPVSSRIFALNLLDDLKAISGHLGGAGKFGAMTAYRLSALAHQQVSNIREDALPDENASMLKSVAIVTATANEAAKIGLNLLAANRDSIRGGALDVQPEAIIQAVDPIEASREYQRLINGA